MSTYDTVICNERSTLSTLYVMGSIMQPLIKLVSKVKTCTLLKNRATHSPDRLCILQLAFSSEKKNKTILICCAWLCHCCYGEIFGVCWFVCHPIHQKVKKKSSPLSQLLIAFWKITLTHIHRTWHNSVKTALFSVHLNTKLKGGHAHLTHTCAYIHTYPSPTASFSRELHSSCMAQYPTRDQYLVWRSAMAKWPRYRF